MGHGVTPRHRASITDERSRDAERTAAAARWNGFKQIERLCALAPTLMQLRALRHAPHPEALMRRTPENVKAELFQSLIEGVGGFAMCIVFIACVWLVFGR